MTSDDLHRDLRAAMRGRELGHTRPPLDLSDTERVALAMALDVVLSGQPWSDGDRERQILRELREKIRAGLAL